MEVGIVGSPHSGKTTLFRLLTGMAGSKPGGSTASVGFMEVPDERLRILGETYKVRKIIHARMGVADIQPHKGQELLNAVRNLDALVVVLGCFMEEPGVRDSWIFWTTWMQSFTLRIWLQWKAGSPGLRPTRPSP